MVAGPAGDPAARQEVVGGAEDDHRERPDDNSPCLYCQAHTLLGAHNFGISDAKLADVWTYGSSPHYSVRERLALDFALAAASQPNAVTDAQFAELQQHWSDGEITEILGVVAMFAFLNRWNDTMGTPLEAPATDVADKAIGARGWTSGKHSDL